MPPACFRVFGTLFFLLLFGGILRGTQAQSSGVASVHLTMDFSNAEATLALLEPAGITPDTIKAFDSLPATKAVFDKVRRRASSVTPNIMTESLRKVAVGETITEDPFQWKSVYRKRDEIKGLLSRLKSEQEAIRQRLIDRLAPMFMSGQTLDVTVHLIVGSSSAGWANDANNLYIGIHFYQGDFDGVLYTLQHELFHNVQYAAYPHEKSDLSKLSAREKEVYSLLQTLFMEGTATYFADVEDFSPGGKFIQEMLGPQRENMERIDEDFLLLDLFLYRLSRPGDLTFADLYPIGFDWSWKNPMYFVGYSMCKALAKANGPAYLKQALQRNPVRFAEDYIALCQSRAKTGRLPALAADSVQTILALSKKLNKKNEARP